MKILVAHNAYQHRGGEDSVAEAEVAMLRSRGHAVETYWRSNDDITGMSKVRAVVQTIWSNQTARELESLILAFKPDVIHVHNTMPLISPSLYWVAHKHQVPVVQTLHNFRLICPQALLLRDGRVCEDCVGKVPWRGVVHGCYRGSVAQTGVLALMLSSHRLLGTWQNKVTRYIALNEFARDKYIEGGLPADRIMVKPNFVDVARHTPVERSGFLFVGRLSEEKGIAVLMEAARQLPMGQRLRVVGSGPLMPLVKNHPNVDYLGPLDAAAVYAEMRSAQALIVPSICYENYPRTIVEAFACGLPVLASNLGAIPGIVKAGSTGALFEPSNVESLVACLLWASAHEQALAEMGLQARAHYEAELTPEVNYQQLMAVYLQAQAAMRC